MKDFRFQGTDLDVTFRTDAIDVGSLYSGKFTVHEIRGLDSANIDRPDEVKLLTEFQKLPYTYEAFINFANNNNLRLTVADSTGDNSVVLTEESGSESVSGSVSGLFDE